MSNPHYIVVQGALFILWPEADKNETFRLIQIDITLA